MPHTLPPLDPAAIAAAQNARAWPFEEAKKVVARIEKSGKGEAVFETGYGPSGLPHIGTFGEVMRTTMVRTAFRLLTCDAIPTRLISFSDDMDGLRKVPTNVPNQELLTAALGLPVSRVPNPFGSDAPSFAAHNNARLRSFLDDFGFDYEFASAADYYGSGRFDAALMRMLEVYDDVMAIILPTLGDERKATYSPFLPICPRTGKVLQVPIVERDVEAGRIAYLDPETGERIETAVTGGRVKCQWKADWALRWYALGVDYEMAGKDLIDSVRLSSRIVAALGGTPPEGFNYELFLDKEGAKISKSKGNGLSIEEWLTYASPESLSLFMFQKPRTAKRLYFDVIPKTVDEYYAFAESAQDQDAAALLENPAFHIHSARPPAHDLPISFALMLNLVSAANAEDESVLWGFIENYVPGATPQTHPELAKLVGFAIRYFNDFVKPEKTFRAASDLEATALRALHAALEAESGSNDGKALQDIVYAIGNAHSFDNLRDWFKAIYQVLLGADQGPRFGSFIALYGVDNTRKLIERGLNGELLADAAP